MVQHQEVEQAQATQMEGGVPYQGMLVEEEHHLEVGVVEEGRHLEEVGEGEGVGHHLGMVVEEVVGDLHQEMEVGEVVVDLHQGVVVGEEVEVVLHHLVGVGEGADHLENKNIMNLKFYM